MDAKQLISMGVAYAGISNAELARRLGWSPQLLNKRINTGKLTIDEWEHIGVAMGAEMRMLFVFPDGKEVG